jgi:hypothetical protein
MFYITKKQALKAGLTHEGKLFGVPAYFGTDYGHAVTATPKVPVLNLYCLLADALYEFASYFLHGHHVLHTPIKIERPIK